MKIIEIDPLRYQEIILDLYEDNLKRNDILQKRFGIPMEKQNLNGLKSEQTFFDEFVFKDKEVEE